MARKISQLPPASSPLLGDEITEGVQDGSSVGIPSRLYTTLGVEVENIALTNYDLNSADVGNYLRFTNAAAKIVNIRTNDNHALPLYGEWHIRNIGTADLTFVPQSGVTVNLPANGTLIVPRGGTVTLKRVGVDEFDLTGLTVSS